MSRNQLLKRSLERGKRPCKVDWRQQKLMNSAAMSRTTSGVAYNLIDIKWSVSTAAGAIDMAGARVSTSTHAHCIGFTHTGLVASTEQETLGLASLV